MAFASNTSAFGMKPSTTSLFGGGTQQQQPATSNAPPLTSTPAFGAFGQPQQQNTQQQAPSTGGIFGQSQQQPQQGQQQSATGLFGQPQQQGQQQPATNIFGQPQQQQQQPSTGLFGQTQQQQPSTNIFGQPQQQQQPQQQAQTNAFGGTSIFGANANTNTQQQPQQQQQSSLFGGGSIFGGNTQQQQPQQQQQQQQQQPQTGLFGSTLNNNPLRPQATLPSFGSTAGGTGAFGGGSIFGQNSQQQQQQQQNPFGQTSNFNTQAQPTGPPPFTKSTKFNDLPDEAKKIFEQIETFIQGRVQISKELQQRKLGEEPTKGNEAIRNLHKELVQTATLIRNDLHATEDIKTKVNQAVEDTIVATRIIDGFRNPQSGNTYLKDHASFPLEYFARVTDQMQERLVWYKTTMEQIERKLASASNSAQTPQNISATLQAQHASFLALASKTAAVDAELQKVKSWITQDWRARTGSVRDPFNDVVRPVESVGDFGLSRLNVR